MKTGVYILGSVIKKYFMQNKYKIIFLNLVLTSLTFFTPLVFAEVGFAQTDSVGQGLSKVKEKFDCQSQICKSETTGDFIVSIIQILLDITIVIAILFLIVGGYQYITSAGNEEQAKRGLRTVTNAIIGIVVIVLSYTIVTVVSNSIQNGNSN